MTEAKPIRRDFYVYAYYRAGVPIYIGKGCGNRLMRHPSEMKHNRHLYRIILKDQREGANLITRAKIADGLCEQAAYDLEMATIAKIGRWPDGPLVNQTDGGEGVRSPSPEARAAVAAANSIRVVSAETRARIGRAHRGKPKPAEQREKIRLANTGVIFTAERLAKIGAASAGRVFTAERNAKIAAAHKGRPKSEAHREALRESHRRRRIARGDASQLELACGNEKHPPSDHSSRR